MRLVTLFVAAVLLGACASPPALPPIPERVSGGYQPDETERAALLTQIHAYWAALDGADPDRAYGFFDLVYQKQNPLAAWRRSGRDSRLTVPRRVTGIHWLRDVPQVPGPELYGIVTWEAADAKGPVATGQLAWRQEPDGRFVLENTKTRIIRVVR